MTKCTSAQTDNYIQTLTIRPVLALPGNFEILIESQRSAVKDSSTLRALHRVMVTNSALNDLLHVMDECVADVNQGV
jgi:hypothetical protein